MDYGDLGKRIVALIIDTIFLALIGFLLGIALGFVSLIIVPIVVWLYPIIMEGSGWHATFGKRIMGLYVAYSNGEGITYSTAILRSIGKMLSRLIFGVGYLMGFFNEQKQCLHDMIAKTYVLNGKPADYSTLPELVGITGPLAGMIYQIGDNGLAIGRDSVSCQVVIPASQAKVSRVHCYITFNKISGMFVLSDRNSTHGTFLANGSRISYAQPAALKSGDRFYLSTPENTFEVR